MSWIEHRLLWGSIEVVILALLAGGVALLLGSRHARLIALVWLIVPLKAILTFAPGMSVNIGRLIPVPWTRGISSPLPSTGAGDISESLENVGRQQESGRGVANPFISSAYGRGNSPGSVLVILWLGGVVSMAGLQILRFVQIRRFVRSQRRQPSWFPAVFAEETRRCGFANPPVLVVSDHVPSPAVFGGVRATLLLPAWLMSSPGDPRLRWILRHELMHLRHCDHWVLLIQTIAGVLFWFHPFVWWARRNWRRHMERACDDAVATNAGDARQYAETLISVMERLFADRHGLRSAPALFAIRTESGSRIKRLLDRNRRVPGPLGPFGVAAWIIVAVAAAGVGLRPPLARASDSPGAGARVSVKVDLGPDDQRVEAGWVRWSGDRDQDFSAPFDDDFEVEIDRNHSWRDRDDGDDSGDERDDDKDPARNAELPLRFMLRDGLRERDDRDIRIAFRNLDPGDYVLELFSCDLGEETRAAVGRFDVEINGKVVLQNQSSMGRVSPAGAALPPITLTSRGDRIVVKLLRREGDVWLNGFVLTGTVRAAGR